MSLVYTVLQLFCICATRNVISPMIYVLYFYISTSRSLCAVPNMAVVCSSLLLCFPGVLLRYCLSDYEMVPVIPFITSITFAFTFRMHWISIMRSLYFKIFSAYFLITFLSPEIATSIRTHVPFFTILDCNFQFIVRKGSVSLHLLIPQYSYLTLMTCL
jgi:hypothetical protein